MTEWDDRMAKTRAIHSGAMLYLASLTHYPTHIEVDEAVTLSGDAYHDAYAYVLEPEDEDE